LFGKVGGRGLSEHQVRGAGNVQHGAEGGITVGLGTVALDGLAVAEEEVGGEQDEDQAAGEAAHDYCCFKRRLQTIKNKDLIQILFFNCVLIFMRKKIYFRGCTIKCIFCSFKQEQPIKL
jgi:hypothetical protein